MPRKTPGKVGPPPSQADFDALPLGRFCRERGGVFVRMHGLNSTTRKPWPALHFSTRGATRFDPADGVGTLCLAETLAGAMMEIFDDQWGPVGSIGRSLTARQLGEWWVTLVSVPPLRLFDATGVNLSKIGTDAQLLTGDYLTTRQWALRLMRHPAAIDGVLYPSRHDPRRRNIALFQRSPARATRADRKLCEENLRSWERAGTHGAALVLGRAVVLQEHPATFAALRALEVGLLS